ncbi:MAG: T9SS type A sorting domain-containing protein [Bacteroidia bacterium]|nr:T9SS type A sorting domain-containing protein [Bacteroidia bacterium]
MKKNIGKSFLFLAFVAALKINAQNCGTVITPQTQSSPIVCTQLLNDFIPTMSEPELEVNVNVWVFQPHGGGVWGTTTQGDVDYMLWTATQTLTTLFLPQLTATPPAVNLPSTRIKLVCKTFSVVTDGTLYNNIHLAASNPAYNDPNAINVYCGACISPCIAHVLLPIPNNFMYFPQGTANNVSQKGGDFAHELGHNLGLGHPTTHENYSSVSSAFGCCDYLVANDVYLEQPNPPWDSCNTPGASNNLMSQNSACQKYLSPLQMAIMHYHLRNSMYRVLTTASKNYVTNVNTAFDLNITSNQTWTVDRYLKGNITVKAGNTLTIKCWVSMAKDARILVEKGAKLVIDGGTVTNFFGALWRGIEVAGSSTQNQNVSGGYGLYQGMVNIINGGTLTNADVAINTGTTAANGSFDWSSTGGIIICNNANFINNRIGVQYQYYHNPNGGNSGSFVRCNFKTNSLLVNGIIPVAHAYMYEVDGIKFSGNSFEYNAGSAYSAANRGAGIVSYDASYFVEQVCNNATNPCTGGYTKNQFVNLYKGISADNTNPLKVPSITNTNFYDCVSHSVYLNNINTVIFSDNYIRTAAVGTGVGLYLNNCKYYNVKNNTFLQNTSGTPKSDVGIYANNSTTGLHKIYRNSFAGFNMGISPQNNNSGSTNNTDGLKMNCNDFTPLANAFDIAMLGSSPTVMRIQGKPTSPWNNNDLVRNKYAAISGCSTCENKWYIVSTSVKTIDHGANSDANTRPTPQPNNSDIAVNVVNSGLPLNYAFDCPVSESGGGGGGGSGRLANLNNYINSLSTNNQMANAKGSAPLILPELKAAWYEKLNYFLLDSLPASKDSVVALLQNNAAGMDDADVQLTYAYINKGDYNMAQQNANSLNNKKADWAALQSSLINLHQNANKAFTLKTNAAAKGFLQGYSTGPDKDGKSNAQSLLKLVDGQDYYIPHLVPLVEEGVKKSKENSLIMEEIKTSFAVYPNPATNLLNFVYTSKEENTVTVTLTSTLGKVVFTADAKPNTQTKIAMDNFTAGVYMLSVYSGKAQVYQTKVICVK